MFVIIKRNLHSDFQRTERVKELTSNELNYAYRSRDNAMDNYAPSIGDYRSMGRTIYTKRVIVKAIEERQIGHIRSISRHFFAVSGIYSRACRYMAYLPTYDYMLTPQIVRPLAKNQVLEDFNHALRFLDGMNLKTRLPEISLQVLIDGAYYGYLRNYGNQSVIQDLPIEYCRSMYRVNNIPVVEFNLDYFDIHFKTKEGKAAALKAMPSEISEEYMRSKANPGSIATSAYGGRWVLLDPSRAIKFTLNKDDSPLFSSAIPSIIDLDDLQGIQKKKAESQLLKIMVQKIPLDKNGEFIFDMEEAKAMHVNAVRMMSRAVNVDVLTTFADSELLDLEEKRAGQTIEIENWEKSTFNDMGISQQLFATDGNLALEKSIANDESIILHLVSQYQDWINVQTRNRFSQNSYYYTFDVWFPRLTQHNRADMARLYKEQAALGYSKTLPALALGQSQSNFLSTLLFEDEYLNLGSIMEPVKMSSTQSGKSEAGRPEKAQDQKSDKTLANEAAGG